MENYVIIEVANTHGGNIDYVHKIIADFNSFQSFFGIKFQPLSPDKIATKDYQWYPVYQELFFNSAEWKEIIASASLTKDVWLDIFDEYGVQILEENNDKIYGIKLQVSVLFNLSVIKALKKLDISNKKLIINISSLSLEEIDSFLNYFNSEMNVEEILLEVGFQSYPTELLDSGLSKIAILKEKFKKRIVFADHIDKDDEYAIWFPSMAILAGADVIEKHIMLTDLETKYDMYSSLNVTQFTKMISILDNCSKLKNAAFINQKEIEYLKNSIMKPILKHTIDKGKLIDVNEDFEFKRSNQDGLNINEINKKIASYQLLNAEIKEGTTIQESNFRKANIAVIIACRLKSTRLKEKALLKIGDLSSVEYCIKNSLDFKNISQIILATSDLSIDSELKAHTYHEDVIFHQGSPDDVVDRYLGIIEKLDIDVFIRITADMPFVDEEICEILLTSHFKSGADYTTAKSAAIGTNLEIINSEALRKVKSHFPNAEYSEYMTWYFQNNPEHFKLNFVDLPKKLVRDYRLTLDYEEDLILFNKINKQLEKSSHKKLDEVFKILDEDKELAKINNHLTLKYKTDQELIDKLNLYTKIKK